MSEREGDKRENLGYSIGSLFSGIGGLELGLEWAGLGHTVWQCEIEPFPRSVLAHHWPGVACYDDVRKIKRGPFVKQPDIICGGFPCQPHSLAGRRAGKDDPRHLWPEFARIIGEFRPSWVVAENVPGIRTNGALTEVLTDLAALGYDAEWARVSAAAMGAPHLRERLFIVAYPALAVADSGSSGRPKDSGGAYANEGAHARGSAKEDHEPDGNAQSNRERNGARGTAAEYPDTDMEGRRSERESEDGRTGRKNPPAIGPDPDGLREIVAEPRVFTAEARQAVPIPAETTVWRTEPDVGRVAHGVSQRVDRLKALGNAVVPQCSYFIGRLIRDAIERERLA